MGSTAPSTTELVLLGATLPLPVLVWMAAYERPAGKRWTWNAFGGLLALWWVGAVAVLVGWSQKLSLHLFAMAIQIALPLAVQLWDKRRLAEEARARSWSVATWGVALMYLGPVTLLPWSWVTRRGVARYLWGPAALAAVLVALQSVTIGAYALVGESLEGWLEGYVVAAAAFPVGVALLLGVLAVSEGVRGLGWLVARGRRRVGAAVAERHR